MTKAAASAAPLLIPEPALQALPALAAEIGINESIVLQQIHYWSLLKVRAGEEPWVYNTQEDWIKEFPWLSLRTFQRVVDRLKALELLETRQPEGTNRRIHYRVTYANLPQWEHAKVAASSRQNGSLSSNTETSTERTSKSPSKKSERKVGGKAVSDLELDLAAAVVVAFNEIFGTALTVDPHLTPIVGRIREKPQLKPEHHRMVIEAVFEGDHWWSGAPGPRIIYGNAAQFETSIEMARAAAKKPKRYDVNAEADRMKREQEEGLD